MDLELLDEKSKQKIISKMSIEEKAKHYCLPDSLSIKEICSLVYPIAKNDINEDNCNSQLHDCCISQLVDACIDKKIKCYCTHLDVNNYTNNDLILLKNIESIEENKFITYSDKEIIIRNFYSDSLIHKEDFKNYLEELGKWPINGLISNWWVEEQTKNDQDNINNPQFEDKTKTEKLELKKVRRKFKEYTQDRHFALMINELCKDIEYRDQMENDIAWNKIVTQEFKSNYIKKYPETKNGTLILTNDEKITKKNFCGRYRKRFDPINE